MKTVIILICLSVMVLGENLYAQGNGRKAVSFAEWLERDRFAELLNHYGIKEGDKNKKNEKRRTVFSEIKFELPDNLTFRDNGSGKVLPIIHSDKWENKNYIGTDELNADSGVGIYSDNNSQSGPIGYITITYTNSQYYSRRALTVAIFGQTNRLFDRKEFTFPEGIGDDYCFRYGHRWIYFVRDYTVFSIYCLDPEKFNIDIEKLAIEIDQKFMESNKKLNEHKTVKGKEIILDNFRMWK